MIHLHNLTINHLPKMLYFNLVFLFTRRTQAVKRDVVYIVETFEFSTTLAVLSFLRKQESSLFKGFIDSRFRGNDRE
jgi:hypothetical protein